MLNDTQCKQAKAGEKSLKLSDEKGLYLLISTAGAKYWRMDYRFAGKRKTLALGVYPETPLKLARQKRDEARRQLDSGTDPSEARRTEKIARKVAADSSFEVVAREWHEKQKGEWVETYAAKVLTSLEQDLFPSLGRRPIAEISAAEMLATLKKIEARGVLETLKRVRQRASDIFLYGIATGRVENNPVNGLHKALKTASTKHRPALHSTGMHEFFIRLDAAGITVMVKHAITLLALTFLRPGELRGARWAEIDLDAGTWIVPAERDRSRGLVGMKMKEEHTVSLSTQAVAVLREMQNITGHRDLVFPNRNDPKRPMSDGTINSALRAMGYAGDEVTGAGFRTTATGALLEMGWRLEVIDRQLAHRERKEVFGAYSHQAEYLAERRKMMQQWADWLPVNIVKSETNVTTFVFNSGYNLTLAKPVRVVTIEGDPWFVAADINEALGWSYQNLRYHCVATLSEAEFRTVSKRDASQTGKSSLFLGRTAWVSLISESGLYKLIVRSDRPEAKQFQNWVTQQVLPSIRKTGAYVVGQAPIETQKDDPFAFVEGQMAEREARLKLKAQVREQTAQRT